jgi:hypothetical protein
VLVTLFTIRFLLPATLADHPRAAAAAAAAAMHRPQVSTLENSVAEQSGKVDQALALAQDW